jgi:isocitrate lyase
MARGPLGRYFQALSVEEVQDLGPDILQALLVPCPADKMFSNEIRMGAFKALTKYNFVEGVLAGVEYAKTQGGHGSENRTAEIMKEIVKYGTAAKVAIPGLRELIDQFNAEAKAGKFPGGAFNQRRTIPVEETIKSIEAATTQPELRTIKK